jgi:TonB family protein
VRCRARDLGAPLALSIVAHGGAVAAMGALTAAWLAGSPPAPPPPALYVDLVHPVVATRDRSEATDTSRPSSGIARPQAPLGGPEPRPSSSVTRSSDRPPADPGVRTAEADRPASTTPEVRHPPAVPVPPAAPGLSVPGVEPLIPEPVATHAAVLPSAVAPPAAMPPAASRPAAMPPAAMHPAEMPPAPLPPVTPSPAPLLAAPRPAAPAPVESGSHGPARDTATASPTGTSRIAPTSSIDLADGGLAVPLSDAKASGLSRGPGGVEAEDPSDPKGSARTDALGSGSADSPAAAGTALARLPAGEPRGGSGSDGAIPPEYEPYVRALRQRIQDRLVYPWTSVRRGQQGVVELEVRVGPDGRLVAVEVLAGASPDALRVAAMEAVRGAAPFPFPPGLAARPLVIRLPVEFRLR